MIRLNLKREPYWVELIDGLRVQVAPITSAMMSAAATSPELRGLPPDANADFRLMIFSIKVAKLAIIGWEGVAGEDDQPAEVTPEGIAALMDFYTIASAFQDKCVIPHLQVSAEKNG